MGRGAVTVGPPGNSGTLLTVLGRWRHDHCGRPSHRGETKISKPTVEVYSGSY